MYKGTVTRGIDWASLYDGGITSSSSGNLETGGRAAMTREIVGGDVGVAEGAEYGGIAAAKG